MKKQGNQADSSVTGGLLQTLMQRHKEAVGKQLAPAPATVATPVAPVSDYQDSGNGYNSNGVIPQK